MQIKFYGYIHRWEKYIIQLIEFYGMIFCPRPGTRWGRNYRYIFKINKPIEVLGLRLLIPYSNQKDNTSPLLWQSEEGYACADFIPGLFSFSDQLVYYNQLLTCRINSSLYITMKNYVSFLEHCNNIHPITLYSLV